MEEKSCIIEMHQAGTKGVHIAAQSDHPTTTIYAFIKNFRLCKGALIVDS
jgi:hypothetical protein